MGYASATLFSSGIVGRTKKRTKREQNAIKKRRRRKSLSDANHGTSSSHGGARAVIGQEAPMVMTHPMVEMVFFALDYQQCFMVTFNNDTLSNTEYNSRKYRLLRTCCQLSDSHVRLFMISRSSKR